MTSILARNPETDYSKVRQMRIYWLAREAVASGILT